jgi:hypothetical protein
MIVGLHLVRLDRKLDEILANQARIISNEQRILELLGRSLPVAAKMTLTVNPKGETPNMEEKAVKATLDLQLPDSGTGTAALTFTDAAGLPATLPTGIVPVWSSSNPAIVLTPSADGTSCQFGPATPPVLATGVVITAVTTLASGTVITATGNPIDVIGGGPAGVTMAEVVN